MRTPLHHAVFGNSEAAVKLFLERGANPNIRCEGDSAYPLHFAVEKHRLPLIRLLVGHGADTIGENDYHELGVIGWATAWDYIQPNPEIAAYLLAHDARHNIFSAVAVGEAEVIRELVARTPNDLERRMNGLRMRPMPLHLAVMKNQPSSLATLLDIGANTESLDEAGFSALDLAALRGRHELAQMLLAHGAKVRLPAAVALNRTADVERLLRSDPGTLKPGGRWGNLIVRASERAPGDVIATLIRNGASVNVHDDPKTSIDSTSGYTPLHAAAWYGNLSAIDVLMKRGADVRAREEKYRGTPAGWADYAGHKEARDLILRGSIDIIEAIQYDIVERVKAVLEEDPAALDRALGDYGLFPGDAEAWQTPLAYAVTRGREEIVRLLIERGAVQTIVSPGGATLSEIAQKAGHQGITLLLDRASRGDA